MLLTAGEAIENAYVFIEILKKSVFRAIYEDGEPSRVLLKEMLWLKRPAKK